MIGKLANTEARSIPERGNHLWSNDFTAGYQLVTLFLRRNHRRFLLVCASQHDVGHSHRLEGMCSALHDGGIPKEDIMIQEVKEYLRISGNQIAMNLACKKDKPDAIIFTNGAICCGFISGCVNMNLRIPEEFSVASFEDSTELEQLPIPVTAMHTPAEQLGLAAAKNLLMQINHQKLPPPQIIQHQLKLRNTIAQR